MAKILNVPSGLIMKVHPSEIEVFISSYTEGNPYNVGEKASLKTGLYCETVMASKKPLLVPNALKDPAWAKNPDIKLNMIYYLGFPILWPNGHVFGTICVLDEHANDNATAYFDLMKEFSEIIERDLALITKEKELKDYTSQLEDFNSVLLEREERIIEMKEEVNTLSEELGRSKPYPEIWKE